MISGPKPIWDPWNVPREQGGWCCGQCGYVLEQEDFLGQYIGIEFRVKGYKCPNCGHQHGAGRQYNWRLLPIPTICASHQGARN